MMRLHRAATTRQRIFGNSASVEREFALIIHNSPPAEDAVTAESSTKPAMFSRELLPHDKIRQIPHWSVRQQTHLNAAVGNGRLTMIAGSRLPPRIMTVRGLLDARNHCFLHFWTSALEEFFLGCPHFTGR